MILALNLFPHVFESLCSKRNKAAVAAAYLVVGWFEERREYKRHALARITHRNLYINRSSSKVVSVRGLCLCTLGSSSACLS
jgi:hypothetical protein